MSNTPILTQSEEDSAPWNDKTTPVDVTISLTMSKTVSVDISNEEDFRDEVLSQVDLPCDKYKDWNIDDFEIIKE